MRHMNSEFYEYILRERDGRTNADEDKDDSMCASLICTRPPSPPRGTVSRRLRSVQYGEIMTRPEKTDLGTVPSRESNTRALSCENRARA